ncbi:unnamed protein product [Phaedon cochleariae]|uniref:Regulatory protein zeste n=1 Tax=Phaedon cochleariae TaxID=80249 RepID=A0A9N9X3H0_PHACE|nr:unnamed protein product [Phaedon cochleariae]
MRVSNDHWTTILEFSELHKEIITNRFSTHFNGKQKNVELWEDLATKLNSLGQGERSVEEWKKKLADWKSKTKAKSAKIYKYIHGTGGGPSINIKLTTLEEKLLSLMGTAAAYGDKTVAEKGGGTQKDSKHNHNEIIQCLVPSLVGLKRKLNEHVEEKKQSLGPNGARSEEYIKDPRNSSKNQQMRIS